MLRVGDGLEVTATVRNVSAGPVFFDRSAVGYAIGHVKIRGPGGIHLKEFLTANILVPPSSRANYVEIKQGDQWTITFQGILESTTLFDISDVERTLVNGLFINFKGSAVLVPHEGQYELHVEIEHSPEVSRYGTEFGLQNVWHGKLTSAPVRITILPVGGA